MIVWTCMIAWVSAEESKPEKDIDVLLVWNGRVIIGRQYGRLWVSCDSSAPGQVIDGVTYWSWLPDIPREH
jgi:hypothetical protein